MRREAAIRSDFVVIPKAQRTPPGIRVRWGEMMPGLEPAAPITSKRVKGPTFDHGILRELCHVGWTQLSSLEIETFETLGF
jgi:hypothetical protein